MIDHVRQGLRLTMYAGVANLIMVDSRHVFEISVDIVREVIVPNAG